MGFLSSLGSAFGGLSGGLIGGIFNNASSISSQQRQNRYNREMWNMENEYNKPINQMNRLREAGVNPNMAFASGTGANTSAHFATSAGRDTSGLGNGFQHGLDNLLNVKQTLQNLRIAREAQSNATRETDASISVKKAEASRIRAETERLKRENYYNQGGSERDPFFLRMFKRSNRAVKKAVRDYKSQSYTARDAMRDILIDSGLNPTEFGY